ncbi:MAG TPA: hypothetical protein VGP50_15570 [Stellaceae bacterium]|jgi:hypothetical protein|nr:hypothetical protein [Stellaceae bacterium]
MLTRLSAPKLLKPALLGLALVPLVLSLGASPAAARGGVFLGFDFVGPPAYYYPPPYYYAPPPPVVYAPPPVYAAPPVYGTAPPAAPVYQSHAGQTCREYQTTVTVDGQQQPGYGTACLQPDGTWRMIN